MKTVPARYQNVKSHAGIRKDLSTGRYCPYKKIKGKRYSATFDTLREAIQWRLTFLPVEEESPTGGITFGELLKLYDEKHITNLALSTQGVRRDRMKIFKELHDFKVESLTPEIINQFFLTQVSEAKRRKSLRMNFNQEIKDLKAILNWYREFYNHMYMLPVMTKRLQQLCTISQARKIKQKLTGEEFLRFFEALPLLYKDLALIQSRIAGRCGEATGILIKNIDFPNRTLVIKTVISTGRKKEFLEIKKMPKTGEVRYCYITDDMMDVINRRIALRSDKTDLLFHEDGKPLNYRRIQYFYDKALKETNLYHKTSGTHMVRHFTATLTRLVCGNLDSVQAITGHKSMKLVEHYGALSSRLQEESISQVELHLKQLSTNMNSGCSSGVQSLTTGSQKNSDTR